MLYTKYFFKRNKITKEINGIIRSNLYITIVNKLYMQCLFKTKQILIGVKTLLKLMSSRDSANNFEYSSSRTLDPHI